MKGIKKTEDLDLEVMTLRKAAMVLRAINHKLRQEMLRLIHSKGTITVTEIYIKLRLEQSVASQHLAILRNAGYVNTERDGKFRHYSVNQDRIRDVTDKARRILQNGK